MRGVLVLLMLVMAPCAWAQPVVGVVGALSGTATVKRNDASVALSAGQEVREGAVVQTGPDSRLRLRLADGTDLTLGAETAVRLDHLALAHEAAPTRISHLVGFLRALVAPQHGPGGLEIATDTVVAAVRGTEWIQHAQPGNTEILVDSGLVALQGAAGAVTLAPGEGVTFEAVLAPSAGPATRALRPFSHPLQVTRWAPAKVAAFEAATRMP